MNIFFTWNFLSFLKRSRKDWTLASTCWAAEASAAFLACLNGKKEIGFVNKANEMKFTEVWKWKFFDQTKFENTEIAFAIKALMSC